VLGIYSPQVPQPTLRKYISSQEKKIISLQAWNLWKDGKAEDLLDSSVKEYCPSDEVSRCIHIGLLCVQDHPECRPLMSAVMSMLENKTTQLPVPTEPVYFVRRDAEPGRAGYKVLSLNGMTFTELEGR